jgi:hypothetical protein
MKQNAHVVSHLGRAILADTHLTARFVIGISSILDWRRASRMSDAVHSSGPKVTIHSLRIGYSLQALDQIYG